MNTLTKTDAIDKIKYGFTATHPLGGSISEVVNVISFYPRRERRQLRFTGNCSAKDGWTLEYLGDR